MNVMENLEFFAQSFVNIMRRSLTVADQPLVWTIIANPLARGFTNPARWKYNHKIMRAFLDIARDNPEREWVESSRTAREMNGGNRARPGLALTEGPGHAAAITRALLNEAQAESIASTGSAASGGTGAFYLIIIAGGDGTSREVLSVLYGLPAELRPRFAALRLPMGTGNDGADGYFLYEALRLIAHPSHVKLQRAVMLKTARSGGMPVDPPLSAPPNRGAERGPFLAFNILSVGLDAFVTHMTNRMKTRIPGDAYKLWVDLAALFYDRLYQVGPLNVKAFDQAGELVQSFTEKVLLLAVGVSGKRTYGGRKLILPDERNVCMVKQMPLLRKLVMKGRFTYGKHVSEPESLLFTASRVEFSGKHPILAQMDGETALLEPEDFPAAIELTAPVIPVLTPGSAWPGVDKR
ncbi:MAG: diacylglycerol kinase [Treponema sp.]|jgi:diacylglycerol kinase family enzyme|nr:diacylglycerol kinase [Treponema sp.]